MKFPHILIQALSLLSLSASGEATSISRDDLCWPHRPFKPLPPSSHRKKVCHVPSRGDGSDDSAAILRALRNCNNGGKVVFDRDNHYTIGTALDLTFLRHIDLGRTDISVPSYLCIYNTRWLTRFISTRNPRNDPIHQRHRLLAGPLLPAGLPERDDLLPAGRRGRQRLRRRHAGRQRPGLVRPVRQGQPDPAAHPGGHRRAAWGHDRPAEAAALAAVVPSGGELV